MQIQQIRVCISMNIKSQIYFVYIPNKKKENINNNNDNKDAKIQNTCK